MLRPVLHYIPETPYGLPVIVPQWFKGDMDWAQTEWVTDGVSVLANGCQRSAAHARGDVLKSFQQAANGLPVRATNCFWMATRRGDGTLRVTLTGADYLDPVDRDVELTALGRIKSLRDVISGRAIPSKGNRAKLTIPAGTFRIVDILVTRS